METGRYLFRGTCRWVGSGLAGGQRRREGEDVLGLIDHGLQILLVRELATNSGVGERRARPRLEAIALGSRDSMGLSVDVSARLDLLAADSGP